MGVFKFIEKVMIELRFLNTNVMIDHMLESDPIFLR